MKREKKQREWAKEVAVAHSDLITLYGVIGMLEGGTISAASQAAAARIIRACKTESGKCLVRYDHALAQIGEYAE